MCLGGECVSRAGYHLVWTERVGWVVTAALYPPFQIANSYATPRRRSHETLSDPDLLLWPESVSDRLSMESKSDWAQLTAVCEGTHTPDSRQPRHLHLRCTLALGFRPPVPHACDFAPHRRLSSPPCRPRLSPVALRTLLGKLEVGGDGPMTRRRLCQQSSASERCLLLYW